MMMSQSISPFITYYKGNLPRSLNDEDKRLLEQGTDLELNQPLYKTVCLTNNNYDPAPPLSTGPGGFLVYSSKNLKNRSA